MKTMPTVIFALALSVLVGKVCAAGEFDFERSAAVAIPSFHSNSSSPYLKRLREEYSLGDLVRGYGSDLERVLAITKWVNGRWQHDGANLPIENDPISILKEAQAGARFRCVEYSIVLTGALSSVGYPSRVVGLMTSDVEKAEVGAGHVVSEVYLSDLKKWVMLDAQFNLAPIVRGVPANAAELALELNSKRPAVVMRNLMGDFSQSADYSRWIRPYLYYLTAGFDNRYVYVKNRRNLRLAPVRAKEPYVFQRKYSMQPALFTHQVPLFYPTPTTLDSDE